MFLIKNNLGKKCAWILKLVLGGKSDRSQVFSALPPSMPPRCPEDRREVDGPRNRPGRYGIPCREFNFEDYLCTT
jgi:hypothetical protein